MPKYRNDVNRYRPVHLDKIKKAPTAKETYQPLQPYGVPGYLRVHAVYQGGPNPNKGVYHIAVIDEVTQFEVVYSVEKISEHYLIPVLEIIVETFPFQIKTFRSLQGLDCINQTVLKLLNKLWAEWTTLCALQPDERGYVAGQSASHIKKTLGYIHIPQKQAEKMNEFNQRYWIPYINFHRPCFFGTETVEKKEKSNTEDHHDNVMTPYKKLKSLPDAETFLKPGLTFAILDQQWLHLTEWEAMKQVRIEQEKLFEDIGYYSYQNNTVKQPSS